MKDSATISWNAVNATEAFLNGKKVDANGSLKVAPEENTTYVLKAKGQLNEDSLILLQKVYRPKLTKVYTYYSKSTSEFHQGDTINNSLKFFDQKSKAITDSAYNVNWTIVEGYGQLLNKKENKIQFVADSAGTIKISEVINNVAYNITFIVKSNPTAIKIEKNNDLLCYPNPVTNTLNFNINLMAPANIKVQITDLAGRICVNENRSMLVAGLQTLSINTNKLGKGTYMYDLEMASKHYTGKILKE
jgi:hypothetical protein